MSDQFDGLRDAVLIYGGLLFCDRCRREANPHAPVFEDDEYDAQAEAMRREGWTASEDCLSVYCPDCSAAGSATPGDER